MRSSDWSADVCASDRLEIVLARAANGNVSQHERVCSRFVRALQAGVSPLPLHCGRWDGTGGRARGGVAPLPVTPYRPMKLSAMEQAAGPRITTNRVGRMNRISGTVMIAGRRAAFS